MGDERDDLHHRRVSGGHRGLGDGPLGDRLGSADHRVGHTLEAALSTLVTEGQAHEAVEDRRARRLNRLVERESSTLMGILVELAERRAGVLIELRSGLVVRGTITAVGADAVIVFSAVARQRSVLRTHAIATVRAIEAQEVTGDRSPTWSTTFHDIVTDLSGHDDNVTVHVGGGDPVTGTLLWVGIDVLCLAATQPPTDQLGLGTQAYVALDSVTAVLTL
jgi:hypothetical protein